MYTPSLYSCNSQGQYSNGRRKPSPAQAVCGHPAQTASEPRTSSSSGNRRPSSAFSVTSLNDVLNWGCGNALPAIADDEDAALQEVHESRLTHANLKRHTLMKVFAEDVINAYFGERAYTPDDLDEDHEYRVRSVSVGSPVLELGLQDWDSVAQLAHRAEVVEEHGGLRSSTDATVFDAGMFDPAPSSLPTPAISCVDTLDRVYKMYDESDTSSPPPLPTPYSQTDSADTVINEREEMIDVFIEPKWDISSPPAVRWCTTIRNPGAKGNRVVSTPLLANELPRIGTIRHLPGHSDTADMPAKPVVIRQDPHFTDMLNELKQWRMSWQLPAKIKPGVAYIPPTTEREFCQQKQLITSCPTSSATNSLCNSPSPPTTLCSESVSSTFSSPSTPSTSTFNTVSPSVYSVMTDGVTPARLPRTRLRRSNDWSAHTYHSLRSDIDATIQLYSGLETKAPLPVARFNTRFAWVKEEDETVLDEVNRTLTAQRRPGSPKREGCVYLDVL